MTFEVDGKEYELKYNEKRIDIIEKVTEKPLMAAITKNDGALSRLDLINYIAYGTKEMDSDVFVQPKIGRELAETLMHSVGYSECVGMVLQTLQEDCGFFFQDA